MSKNPKHRPPNMRRIESMARSLSTALADARIIENHDLVELYEHTPILNIPDKRCF
jgi:hypothetical protein